MGTNKPDMKKIQILILTAFICGVALAQMSEVEDMPRRLALRQLVERADSGDAKALYDLAYLHDIGYDSIPVDSVRSTLLYRLSAEKGYAPARNFLGFRYYMGEYLTQNVDSALYWIRLAAIDGDITAAANLGYLLSDSDNVEHNEEEALEWLAVAADAGLPAAQVKLVEIAERVGSPKAYALLGDAYSKGQGVAYDHKKSIEYFYKAAEEGNPSAQFILAELLEFFPDILSDVNEPGISASAADGIHPSYRDWYEEAAAAGIHNSDDAYRHLYTPQLKKLPKISDINGIQSDSSF